MVTIKFKSENVCFMDDGSNIGRPTTEKYYKYRFNGRIYPILRDGAERFIVVRGERLYFKGDD
jgi:hypothetical protein